MNARVAGSRQTPLNQLPAWQAVRLLARRELRAEDLARACLDRVAERDAAVHAFAHIDVDAVLTQARELDAGAVRGPLHGLPLGVKDLIDTADLPTAYGSAIYAGHRPAVDAAAVALCRAAGALVFGKTVSTEFAFFQPGPTCNPHQLEHTPGGSSSGSAAAVADLMLPLALGTQTAGSIIRPAAFCGVVGYKPSFGRVPRTGVKGLSDALDVVGGFARHVRDVALLGAVLTGDARMLALADMDSAGAPRIGVCLTPDAAQFDADTQTAFDRASASLAPLAARFAPTVWPADLPDLVRLQKALMSFEMTRALSHERLHHRHQLSAHLTALFEVGDAISGSQHVEHRAQTARAQRSVEALFDGFDVLLAPSAIGEAPHGLAATGDPLFCRGWTLLGLPSIHLPFMVGRHGLPIGLQLVGRINDDHQLLAAAQWVHERLTS